MLVCGGRAAPSDICSGREDDGGPLDAPSRIEVSGFVSAVDPAADVRD
jgi:hypothetical protein